MFFKELSLPVQRKLDLIILLTQKEFALKYKRTVLGIFWSLLNPILLGLVFWVAFKVFMRFRVENYTFFLLTALFPWTWFSSSILISSRSLVDNIHLIKKVIFPRHYLVASVALSQLVHLLFAIPILLFLSYTSFGRIPFTGLCAAPLLIVSQLTLTLGISLIVAIGNTYFRDIEYLVGVLMNLVFWMTPITYPLDAVPEPFRVLVKLNPMASLMNAWRGLFFDNKIYWQDIGLSYIMAVVMLLAGMMIFKKLEKRLDEVL